MAHKSFPLSNASEEMPSNEPVYPQMSDLVGNGSNYQGNPWMPCPATGFPMYSQTSHVPSLPHLANSKSSQMTPQAYPTQRTVPYVNAIPPPVHFGMNYDSNIDEPVLENGEAFTSYTGMDSQTASRTSDWY